MPEVRSVFFKKFTFLRLFMSGFDIEIFFNYNMRNIKIIKGTDIGAFYYEFVRLFLPIFLLYN